MAKQNKTTTIDGVEVEYTILHRTSNDFELEITSPFQNITGGLHIMNLARRHCSFDGEYGDERILQVINNVYGLGRFIAENITYLKEQAVLLDQNVEALTTGSITEGEFKEIRRKSRRQLRKGEISERYHQRILRWWKGELDRVSLERELYYIDPFFEKNFPIIVPHGTREQVLEILRNETRFQEDSHE